MFTRNVNSLMHIHKIYLFIYLFIYFHFSISGKIKNKIKIIRKKEEKK